MKSYKLTKEEQELLDEVEKGNFVRVENFEEEKKRLQQIAQNTLNKKKEVNILLSMKDELKLQKKAEVKGIPYKTFVSSLLHEFANA